MKKKEGGFRKGFLLSTKGAVKKKKQTVHVAPSTTDSTRLVTSSTTDRSLDKRHETLLHEQNNARQQHSTNRFLKSPTPTSSSLLLEVESYPATTQSSTPHSLLAIINDDNDEHDTDSPTTSHDKPLHPSIPLISIVDEESPTSTNETTTFLLNNDHNDNDKSSTPTSIVHAQTTDTPVQIGDSVTTVNHTIVQQSDQPQPHDVTNDFQRVTTDLADILSKLATPARTTWYPIASLFVHETVQLYTSAQHRILWEYLFEAITCETKQRCITQERLAGTILMEGIVLKNHVCLEAFLKLLDDDLSGGQIDKEVRQQHQSRLLTVMSFLDDWLEQPYVESSYEHVATWLVTTILARLVCITQGASSKRTVLTQASWDLSMKIVRGLVDARLASDSLSVFEKLLWTSARQINTLWKVQELWLRDRLVKLNSSSDSEASQKAVEDRIRSYSKLQMVLDFQRLYSSCLDQESELSLHIRKKQWWEGLCVPGTSSPSETEVTLIGGVSDMMTSHRKQASKVEMVLQTLSKATNANTDGHVQRSLLRGITCWFFQHKRHVRMIYDGRPSIVSMLNYLKDILVRTSSYESFVLACSMT